VIIHRSSRPTGLNKFTKELYEAQDSKEKIKSVVTKWENELKEKEAKKDNDWELNRTRLFQLLHAIVSLGKKDDLSRWEKLTRVVEEGIMTGDVDTAIRNIRAL
jgi:hypothetical protein